MVASAVSIQRELRRYSEDNGAFQLEDLEVELPVKMRVDSLGQMMTEVVSDVPTNTALTRIRLRIRPDAEPPDRIPIIADAPLASLKTLTPEHVAFLEAHRIFSVEDLIRAARGAAGRKGLEAVIPPAVLDHSLARGSVLVIPVVPAPVAGALFKVGLGSIDAFQRRDPSHLATVLTRALGQTISKDDVAGWQADLRKLRTLSPRDGAVSPPSATNGGAPKQLPPRLLAKNPVLST